jgi:hypothetical protein
MKRRCISKTIRNAQLASGVASRFGIDIRESRNSEAAEVAPPAARNPETKRVENAEPVSRTEP